ncbi:hypothetical protein BDZ91DRAFT_162398 [Kalaharituber pfeilii]|nr:hypothetical protein BDZ91DRAFT_162398 [Kalaharituber pfeilii]
MITEFPASSLWAIYLFFFFLKKIISLFSQPKCICSDTLKKEKSSGLCICRGMSMDACVCVVVCNETCATHKKFVGLWYSLLLFSSFVPLQ